ADATVRSMPLNALEHTAADYQLPAGEIGELLGRLVREEAPPAPEIATEEQEKTEREVRIAAGADGLEENVMHFGVLSPFTCPECNGVLTMLHEAGNIRFRCHTGHAVSSGTLLDTTAQAIEDKLWYALRADDETV